MPSDIPTARKLLQEATEALDERTRLDLIRRAMSLMTRASPKRRASVQKRMNDDIVKSIKLMANSDPDLQQSDIAAALNVNIGRVSEVLKVQGPYVTNQPLDPDKETKH
jgi:hypothetical protein